MKGINKSFFILAFLLSIFACKKDKVEQQYKSLFPSGVYSFRTFDNPSSGQSALYYLDKDVFYPFGRYSDSICLNRKAGIVVLNNGVYSIPYLYVYDESNICSFENDQYKGKSRIYFIDSMHFNQDIKMPKFNGYYRLYSIYDSTEFSVEPFEMNRIK